MHVFLACTVFWLLGTEYKKASLFLSLPYPCKCHQLWNFISFESFLAMMQFFPWGLTKDEVLESFCEIQRSSEIKIWQRRRGRGFDNNSRCVMCIWNLCFLSRRRSFELAIKAGRGSSEDGGWWGKVVNVAKMEQTNLAKYNVFTISVNIWASHPSLLSGAFSIDHL